MRELQEVDYQHLIEQLSDQGLEEEGQKRVKTLLEAKDIDARSKRGLITALMTSTDDVAQRFLSAFRDMQWQEQISILDLCKADAPEMKKFLQHLVDSKEFIPLVISRATRILEEHLLPIREVSESDSIEGLYQVSHCYFVPYNDSVVQATMPWDISTKITDRKLLSEEDCFVDLINLDFDKEVNVINYITIIQELFFYLIEQQLDIQSDIKLVSFGGGKKPDADPDFISGGSLILEADNHSILYNITLDLGFIDDFYNSTSNF